jgi:heat-inducible transcriptional repressor
MVPNRTARPARPTPRTPGPRVPEEPVTVPGAEDELDPRKAAILNAVVSEYIETAEPVGSAHITGTPGVEVSSATVRSDMAALERDGYLTQPHTSAGRIPTDKGYRFFVDTLTTPGILGPVQRQEVRRFFAHVHGAVEDLLGHTSGLLANLTDYAAVVVGPTHESATIRSVQLVDLGPNLALLVVVLSDGAVEKRAIELAGDIDDTVLAAAAAHMTTHLRGRTLADPGTVPDGGDNDFDTAVRLGTQALGELSAADEPEHVFVGGSSRMASAFDAVETVRSVLSILEQQLVVVEIVEHILDRGLSVAIGSEHGFEPLASCALVLAPVSVDGETAGTIGVVGPTRMNYPRALAAVQVVGERLGERLGGAPAGDAAGREGKGVRPGGSDRGR